VRLRHLVAGWCLVVTTAAVGCRTSPQAPAAPRDELTQSLADVRGTFQWREDLGRYRYSEKPRLEQIVGSRPREATVSRLVDCLDDTSPSQSTLNGKPVATGIICHEALTQMVYHEPTGADGDVANTWPGNISPTATAADLRAAKQAWKKVVESRTFTYL